MHSCPFLASSTTYFTLSHVCLHASSQVWGAGNFVHCLQIPNSSILWMLSLPITISLCGVNISFCHGALEYLGGRTNWGTVPKYVFLKKLTGRQVSVRSFLALIFLLMLYVFSSGAHCGGAGGNEAQENYCWSRCFRVSWPLNAGTISLGLRGSRPKNLYFWPPVIIKNKQIHIRLFYTSSCCF